MKNLYLLPTDKPSIVFKVHEKFYIEPYPIGSINAGNYHAYITSDEEIKDADWICRTKHPALTRVKGNWNNTLDLGYKKIILTTDQNLIKDGVQAIEDKFLEWFVNNSRCEEVSVVKQGSHYWGSNKIEHNNINYKIIIPKEEPKKSFREISKNCGKGVQYCGLHSQQCQCDKIWRNQYLKEEPKYEIIGNDDNRPKSNYCYAKEQGDASFCMFPVCHCGLTIKQETLEEAAEKEYPVNLIENPSCNGYNEPKHIDVNEECRSMFIEGAKWQAERMYSEEEVRELVTDYEYAKFNSSVPLSFTHWFENFKKKQS